MREKIDEIKRKINELTELVTECGGACIIYVDPDGKGEGLQLLHEGYEKNLAMMVGTAILLDDDMKNYIMRGVEAAQYAENKRNRNDKTDC